MKIQDIIDALENDRDYEEIIITALQCKEELPEINYFKAFIYQQITKGELLEVLEKHSASVGRELAT